MSLAIAVRHAISCKASCFLRRRVYFLLHAPTGALSAPCMLKSRSSTVRAFLRRAVQAHSLKESSCLLLASERRGNMMQQPSPSLHHSGIHEMIRSLLAAANVSVADGDSRLLRVPESKMATDAGPGAHLSPAYRCAGPAFSMAAKSPRPSTPPCTPGPGQYVRSTNSMQSHVKSQGFGRQSSARFAKCRSNGESSHQCRSRFTSQAQLCLILFRFLIHN